MRRCVSLLAAGALVLGLSACQGGEDPQAVLERAGRLVREPPESLHAVATAQVDLELSSGGPAERLRTVTTMDLTGFSQPLKLRAAVSTDMDGQGAFAAEVYARQEGETCLVYTCVDGQRFREQAEPEALELYSPFAAAEAYWSSAQWTFQGEEEMEGVPALCFSGAVSGERAAALMADSGVLEGLGTMQYLGVSPENLQGMAQELEDMDARMWIDPESGYPIRYQVDMTAAANGLISGALETLAGMGDPAGELTLRCAQARVTVVCTEYNCAGAFEIPAELSETA